MAIARRFRNSNNPYFGMADLPLRRAKLTDPDISFADDINIRIWVCSFLLRIGDTEGAAEQIETVFTRLESAPSGPLPVPDRWHLLRALTYLRQAEVFNCIKRRNRDCCLFPLRNGGVHAVASPARKARRSYLTYLKLHPDDLSVWWLLNLVSMAVGDYPDSVPAEFRIPPSAFDSDYDIGRFVDIAPSLGIDTFNQCGGVIAEDFTGDGLLDIVTSTFDIAGPLTFYINRGARGFEDASASSRLDQQLGGLNCIGADYDNDGDTDILVLRGAWLHDDGRLRNSLLRNNGDATFTDVTRQAGLATPARPTQIAAWADFDNNGTLDLYVGNESRVEMQDGKGDYPGQLFRNNGDGTFTDIAAAAGVTNDRYCKGVTVGDYDNDGDMDLYLSNFGSNRLYRNNGDGTFTDVAEALNVLEPTRRSFVTWFFDYDNDGWLDLFVAAYDATLGDIAADYLGLPHNATSPCLYHNEQGKRFVNVTKTMGLDHPYLPMGANFGDLDQDGYLDFYLTTGDPEYKTLMPNVMLRNDRGRRFQDVSTAGGFGHLQKGHGVAFADFDHDGDQDIYHQLGGWYEGDRFHNVLFRNPGHGNHFLTVKLIGVTTNRGAVGARIKVVLDTPDGARELHRAVGSVSSFGGSPRRQEIGLGNATGIRSVEIDWPRTGKRQILTGVPMNAMIEVTEGTAGFRRVILVPFEYK